MKYVAILILITHSLFGHSQIPDYVSTNELIGWWSFSGNADDGSGNGSHGVVNGAELVSDRNGLTNSAYYFDGGDHIRITGMPTVYDSYTFAAWIKGEGNIPPAGAGIVVQTGHKSSSNSIIGSFGLSAQADKDDGRHRQADGFLQRITTVDDRTLDWHHQVVTWDGAVLSFHLDGELQGTASVTTIAEIYNELIIGGLSNDALNNVGYFFTGFVDDVGVWSRALLPEEIQELVEGCESIPTFGISGNQTPSNYTATSYSYPATEGSSYEWEVTNGIIQSGQGTSTIDVVWAGEGLGSLMVVETSVNGCVGDPVVLDVVIIPTSVEESSAQPFRVYPNPAAGTLFIECGASTERGQGFDLLDPSGRLVLSGMVQGLRTMLDIQGLPSGVYHLELAGAVRRVIIQ